VPDSQRAIVVTSVRGRIILDEIGSVFVSFVFICTCPNEAINDKWLAMPSTPVERLKTPLRKLRVLLGEFGAPMSQEDFAAQTGLSVATVRSIENERRGLSEKILMAIATRWLAMWNPRDKEWHFLGTKKLYTKDLAQKVKPTREPAEQKLMVERLIDRLRAILEATGHEALPGQIMMLNRLLAKHVEETNLVVDLESTEPLWFLRAHPTADEMKLVAKYPGADRRSAKRTYSVPK
jgi:transcriptional regulator with XRE-family HTH domain